MKPKLFRDDATDFNNMGFGVLTHTTTCEVTEDLGEAPTLTMTMLATDPLFQYVTIGNIIVCQPNKYDQQQAFVIEEVSKNIAEEVTIYATHIAQHRAKLIPVGPFTASSLNDALTKMKTYSLETNPFTLVRDSGKTNVSAAMTVANPISFRELMGGVEGSIIDTYRGEWGYDNFILTLYNKRGHDNGVRIMYRKNMTDFTHTEDFSWNDSLTGAIGYWRKEETLVQGNVQYSSQASDFPFNKTVVVDFSENFEEAPTVSELNTLAAQWINGKGSPAISMEVAFSHLAFDQDKTIQIGDTVTVVNPVYHINTAQRIVGLVYDVLADEYTTVTIGAQKDTINDAISEMFSTDTHKGVFPNVGDVVVTSTHTDPAAHYGGTWELIDKEFTPTKETQRTVTLNSTNCSDCKVYTVHSGHDIQFWIQVTSKVAIADTALTFATLSPGDFGVTSFGDAHRITAFSDAGNALINWYLTANGSLQSLDGWEIKSNPSQSVPARTFDYFMTNISIPWENMLDTGGWCNKFYWKRTA